MDFRNLLNKLPREEAKNENTFDGTLESIARAANVDYKPQAVVFKGYTDDEVRELCHSKNHDCATTVNHPLYGKVNQFTKVMLFQMTTVMLSGTMYNLNTV